MFESDDVTERNLNIVKIYVYVFEILFSKCQLSRNLRSVIE